VSKSAVSSNIVHKTLHAKRRLIDTGGILVPAGVKVERRPITLDKPFLILPSSAFISADQIAPFDSWAKFDLTRRHNAEDVIHFYYMWENPTDAAVQIDVSTSVGFCGFCTTHAEGSFYNSTQTRLWALPRWSYGRGRTSPPIRSLTLQMMCSESAPRQIQYLTATAVGL
jgi:hypothetical protein